MATTDVELSVDEAGQALLDPSAYADGTLERACAVLRRASPVHWVESDVFRPFFALTKHADIHHVETQSDLFRAGPRYRLYRKAEEPPIGEGVRTLVRMDPPEHTEYRALAAPWFHPHNLKQFEATVQAQAKRAVDRMAERNGRPYDFVREIGMLLPLNVIGEMLGVPEGERNLPIGLASPATGRRGRLAGRIFELAVSGRDGLRARPFFPSTSF